MRRERTIDRTTRGARRVTMAAAGVLALGLTVSACSGSTAPSAQGKESTTTTTAAPAHASTSTSTTAVASSSTSTTTGSGAAGQGPVLGLASAWGTSAVGFGQVRPAEISLGGDPTGMLTGITWQSWGGSTATGSGTSTYVGPNQTAAQGMQETATVVASDLGTCGGRAAYQQVKWFFPGQGETFSTGANSTISACSGP